MRGVKVRACAPLVALLSHTLHQATRRLPAVAGEMHGAIFADLNIAPSHERTNEAVALGGLPAGGLVEVLVRGGAPELGQAQEATEEVALGGGSAHISSLPNKQTFIGASLPRNQATPQGWMLGMLLH